MYEYTPPPPLAWPELAGEIWCHRYYLGNLCDEERFRGWPVVEHIQLLQVRLRPALVRACMHARMHTRMRACANVCMLHCCRQEQMHILTLGARRRQRRIAATHAQALMAQWRAELSRQPLAMSEAQACEALGVAAGPDGRVSEDDMRRAYRNLARKCVRAWSAASHCRAACCMHACIAR